MRSKFIFIFDDRVHAGLQVHHVMVGISQREQRAAAKIELAATKNHDIFFRKYDMEVCKFLNKLSCQLYPNLSPDAAKAKFFIFNEKFNETPQQILSSIQPLQRQKPNVSYGRE